MKLRVLIVDDSALMRTALTDTLAQLDGLEIVGHAADGEQGITKAIIERPDLIIMDIEMPQMNGLAALENMRARGITVPVLILSALTYDGAETSLRALELGAFDFVPKPAPDTGIGPAEAAERLLVRVREFAETQELARTGPVPTAGPPKGAAVSSAALPGKRPRLWVIGASTGGPQALHQVLPNLPAKGTPPVLVIQHMPPVFTKAFAERMNGLCPLRVKEAEDGEAIVPGTVYVAPGSHHLRVIAGPGGPLTSLGDDAKLNNHRPSIEASLDSARELFGSRAGAVIMTGMGNDGPQGMLRLRTAGGITISQDEESSVIFGMNRRAIEVGGVGQVLPLAKIAEQMRLYGEREA